MAFLLLLLILVGVGVAFVLKKQQDYGAEAERRKRLAVDRERIERCGEVVLFFANRLGYIARSVISRGELSGIIDEGCGPDELAAEIAGRIEATSGLTLGYHQIGDSRLDVKLTSEHRERHVYIVGKSGSGKTNLMRSMIFQDLEDGHGVGVIAPEAEMITEEILPFIPEHRIDDVIYCNPADEHPVAFNPLHLDPGEDLDAKVDENLTIFHRVMGGGTGPRMEELLRQSFYALVGRPGATLLDIERLLSPVDKTFRDEVVATHADPEVRHFWGGVYPTFPKDAYLPIINRIGRFLRPKTVRNILCNPSQSLNFRRCMDEGKIMLFNLSDGLLGEQNSQLLGQLVVSKFQLATMARAQLPKEGRRQFFLYLDEFQTFTGTSATSYEKMLSRARKYRLGLILAHQQTGQLPGTLLREVLGNVSTTICFLVSREDAAKFSKELVTEIDGEVINILEAEILKLRVGECWCKIGQHAFPMRTYLMDGQPDMEYARFVETQARENAAGMMQAITLHASEATETPPPRTHTRASSAAPPEAQPAPREAPSPAAESVLHNLDPENLFGD